jgi:A/G-specific adenine glycosylase
MFQTQTKNQDSALAENFGQDLLCWYRSNKRPLPWRDRQDDSYAVWISEIMLQQTTVNAVIDYYSRWMQRFPTLQSLAEAPLDDVLKHWAGLGYYARARNLKKAAEAVTERFDGNLPITVAELMTLPGIGRYTAGAISSIAYQQNAPIVDANVTRVLTRIHGLRGDPKQSIKLQQQIWAIAETSIPDGEARDYNQALMELGAIICQPTAPACARCPVQNYCRARTEGEPTRYPEFTGVKKWLDVKHAACFVLHENQMLIIQRPLDQLWGGLWELPRVEVLADETPSEAAVRAVRETVGICVDSARQILSIRHVVTNRKIELTGCSSNWDGAGELQTIGCTAFAWATLEKIETYALSSPQTELISRWKALRQQPLFDI